MHGVSLYKGSDLRLEHYLYAKDGTQEIVVSKSSSCGKFKHVEIKEKKITNTFWERIWLSRGVFSVLSPLNLNQNKFNFKILKKHLFLA